MRFTSCVTALLMASTSLCAVALAQDGGGLRPGSGPSSQPTLGDRDEDLGGWLGEEKVGRDTDILAPPVKSGPSKAEQKRRAKQIDQNYDEAQKIYQEIIRADPVKPLDRRIDGNQKIVREYSQRIAQANQERRQLLVEQFNRAFYLKQQLEKGQITREAYNRLITAEESKTAERLAALKRNIQAWEEELRGAKTRLDNFQSQRRMLEAQRPRRPKARRARAGAPLGGPRARPLEPGEQLLGTLRTQLKQMNHFRVRFTLTQSHPRDLGIPSRKVEEKEEKGFFDKLFD